MKIISLLTAVIFSLAAMLVIFLFGVKVSLFIGAAILIFQGILSMKHKDYHEKMLKKTDIYKYSLLKTKSKGFIDNFHKEFTQVNFIVGIILLINGLMGATSSAALSKSVTLLITISAGLFLFLEYLMNLWILKKFDIYIKYYTWNVFSLTGIIIFIVLVVPFLIRT